MKARKLSLPAQLAASLGIVPGETWNIKVGRATARTVIQEALGGGVNGTRAVALPPGLAADLGLPPGLHLNIIRDGDYLRLGPLVGILAARYIKERDSFGVQNQNFHALLQGLRSLNGSGFVFTPRDIDWKRHRIHGYSSGSEKRWRPRWYPFPDVYYNRFFSKSSIDTRDIMKRFRSYGVQTFNTPIGSKWAVHSYLSQKEDIRRHLPDTHRLLSAQALQAMLEKHREVYIKPGEGHLGRGIMRASKRSGGYLVKSSGSVNGVAYRSLAGVVKALQRNGKLDKFLVQQSIGVVGGDQHFDSRVLVQKDRQNQWQITGLAARVGGSGQITTNLHTGGRAEGINKTLAQRGFSRTEIMAVRAEIKRLALEIAGALGEYSPALGDLGLDFIIDKKGQVWFLEANPRAGRRSVEKMGREAQKLAVLRPMEYACYLAGF